MKHRVPHDLDRAQAKKAAESAWASYSQRLAEYSPTVEWRQEYDADISFKVKGVTLKGSLEVGERDIGLDLDVPFLLRPFKGKALKVVEDEISVWVAKAKRGEI